MNNTFKTERDILFRSYLDRHVFNNWNPDKQAKWSNSLELIFTSACNTECTYCYYKNFGEKLNNACNNKPELVLSNLEKLMKFLKKNNYRPRSFEIFSGEFFNLPYFEKALSIINNNIDYTASVMIPTNCTFAISEEKTQKINQILSKYSNLNIHLSLSTDGALLDNISRPLRTKKPYPIDYYDRLFKFASDHRYSFHPMISPDNIFFWKDNFEWFLQNIQKYFKVSEKHALSYLYLLEVRNPNWDQKSLEALRDFVEYLVDKTFKLYNCNVEDYYNNFLSKKTLNIFYGMVSSIGRGLGCSIQQTFAVRLYDLGIVNCHRTSYEKYLGGFFTENKDGELEIISENPNLYMLINSFDFRQSPFCNECNISNICSLSCIGCNFEVNRDFFIPVRSVCEMEKTKIYSTAKAFFDRGILQEIIKNSSDMLTYLSDGGLSNRSKENSVSRLYQLLNISDELYVNSKTEEKF